MNFRKVLLLVGMILGQGLFQNVLADVSGIVYRDLAVNGSVLNTYGVRDLNELGVAGISVTVVDVSGNVVGTATTATDGTWSVSGTSGKLRVEFSNIPSYLESSPVNTGSNTTVQFVTDGATNVDLGLHEPADYSDTPVPEVVLSSWVGGTADAGGTNAALYSFPFDRNGQNEDDSFQDDPNNGAPKVPAPTVDATASQIGATWGLAYQKNKQRYFASSVIRRHVGLADGTGFIYVIDKSGASTTVDKFDLNGIATVSGGLINLGSICRGGGCENDSGNTGIASDYMLPGSISNPSVDLDAMKKVGKVAFGDIDMQPQTNNLWAVNLNQKSLIKIDVSANNAASLPGAVDQFLIANLAGVPTCVDGEIRPWGLNFSNGKGYLGIVCDASAVTPPNDNSPVPELTGFVVSFDPDNVSSGFTEEISFPLGFTRNANDAKYNFSPWSHNWSDFRLMFGSRYTLPQAMISDIEFDKTGNMNIALIDRSGLQLGTSNYKPISGNTQLVQNQTRGDLYHACITATGYEMEGSSANCPVHNFVFDQGFNQDGEFFEENAGDSDAEGAMGALAMLKGAGKMVMTILDPHPTAKKGRPYWFSQGVNFVDPVNGDIEQFYSLYYSRSIHEFGKASGLGDVELLTAPAPLEIGDRVWKDDNENGLQDPGENPISGVTVELYEAGAKVGSAITNIDGQYIFGGHSATNMNGGSELKPLTAYQIRVALSDVNLTGMVPTQRDVSANGFDSYDNDGDDGSLNTGFSTIVYTTGHSGENDHTLDFGFKEQISLDYGDAPGADYPTTTAANGPVHTLDPALYMGACVDDEANGQSSATANGDDAGIANAATEGNCATTGDDEDGLTPPVLTDGQVAPGFSVAVYNTTGTDAYLACWVDYSGSGFEAAERSATVIVANNATTATVTLPDVPANASTTTGGTSFLRCRLASIEVEINAPTGTAANGEIEDYPVSINAIPVVSLDYGDAPNTDYPTTTAANGPVHTLDPALYMGACVDDEANGQSSATANGDDAGIASAATEGNCTTAGDDEDGLTPPVLTDGQVAPGFSVAVHNTTGTDAYLACWVDYSGSGFEAAERSATVIVANNATTATVTLPDVPANASTTTGGTSFLRCRLASIEAEINDPAGAAANGEIEDYPVSINAIPVVSLDYGDAPNTDYPTTTAANGPVHTLDAALYMGACVDDEANGQSSATANGDDAGIASAATEGNCTTAGDDEDGLTPPVLTDGQVAPGFSVAVHNTTGTDAYLACWVDYSGSGFEAAERSATVIVANNAKTATVTLPDVPANASTTTGGTSFLRCRLASIEAEINDPAGAAANGEIEDYPVSINSVSAGVTGVVWFDTNKDGVKDPGESGLSGWSIEVRDTNGSVIQTLTTQPDGTFSELNIGVGNFTVRFLSPGGIIVKEQQITLNPGDVAFVPEPIDPAGIVYNEDTGAPVPGAQVFLISNGVPLPPACLGVGEQGQATGADGAYNFFLNPGSDPACPVADTVYELQVIPPNGFQTTVNNPPQAGVLNADNCTIDAVAGITCEVSNQTSAPINGVPVYFTQIELGIGDPGVFNNHIPLTPSVNVVPQQPAAPVNPIPTLSEWGRIILMLLIGMMMFVQYRRRSREER